MPISFSCPSCRQQLQVSDAAAGRSGKCPHCKGAILVPLASAPAAIAATPMAPTPMAPTPAPAYSAPAGRRPAWVLIAGLAGGASGLLLLLILIIALFVGTASADAMVFMPENCHAIVMMRGDFLDSPAYKELKPIMEQGAAVPGASGDLNKSAEKMGLEENDIDKMTIGMDLLSASRNRDQVPDMVMVVRTKKTVTADELKAKIKDKTFKEAKAGLYTMYEMAEQRTVFGEPQPLQAFSVVDSRTVVFGTKGTVRQVLERNRRPQFSPSLQAVLGDLDTSKTMVMAFGLKELMNQPAARDLAGQLPDQAKKFTNDLESAVIQVHMDKDIDIDATVTMKTQESAEELRKMTEGLLALAKFGGLPPEASELIDSIKFETRNGKLYGAMKLKTATLVKLAKQNGAGRF